VAEGEWEGVLVGVAVGVLVGELVGVVVGVAVGVAAKDQLVLFPELMEKSAMTAVPFVLLLSFTSTCCTTRVPEGLMLHCVKLIEERSSRF